MHEEIGMMPLKSSNSKDCCNQQKLGGSEEGSSLEGVGSAWPCQHFDLVLVASRTMKEYISDLLSHPVCSTL